jgi:hypothetical protein
VYIARRPEPGIGSGAGPDAIVAEPDVTPVWGKRVASESQIALSMGAMPEQFLDWFEFSHQAVYIRGKSICPRQSMPCRPSQSASDWPTIFVHARAR